MTDRKVYILVSYNNVNFSTGKLLKINIQQPGQFPGTSLIQMVSVIIILFEEPLIVF